MQCRQFISKALRLIWAVIGLWASAPAHGNQAPAVLPTSDFTSQFLEARSLSLRGPWDLYWESLIEPGEPLPAADAKVEAGRPWNDVSLADGRKIPSFGYGTYRLSLKGFESRPEGYEIVLREAGSAYRLILYPEDAPGDWLEASSGQVGRNSEQSIPSKKTTLLRFYPKTAETWVVLLQVSNFHVQRGGAFNIPTLAKSGQLVRGSLVERLSSLLSLGITVALGIYAFMMFIRRRTDRASLLLCLVCIMSIIRTVNADGLVFDALEKTSTLLYNWQVRLAYATIPAIPLFYFMFLEASFPRIVQRRIFAGVCFGSILIAALPLITPIAFFTKILWLFHVHLVGIIAICLVVIVKAYRARAESAGLVLSGALAVAFAGLIDILIVKGLIDSPFIIQYGISIFLILQSQVVAQRAAIAYQRAESLNSQLSGKNKEIEDMNRDLELIVEDRTRELKTIFHNIPQGIASLDAEGLISDSYSRNLEVIVQRGALSRKSILEFFSQTTLSQDMISRLMESLRAAVGEPELCLSINLGNFPREVEVQRETRTFHYALTWGPELTDDGIVHGVLVTIEDVTEKKQLEQESEQQRKDLVLLQELVQCGAEKFNLFSRSSEVLLAENMRLINAGALALDDVKILFINAHTVKGGARTLGLMHLASIIHDVEQQYSLVMKGHTEADQDKLLGAINKAWSIFSDYITYNRDKLGRKTQFNEVSLEISFIKDHYKILDALVLEPNSSPGILLEKIRVSRDRLAELIFKSDTHILEECFQPTEKVAKDLGKPAPLVQIMSHDILISREVESVMRNAMVHILRNSLDHGIEPVEERRLKGKRDAGSIFISTQMDGGMIVIDIADDGRGLDMTRLKEKGILAGLISENASSDAIASMIFITGLSTAQSLTQISGRGVGMDAVRKFVEEAGGTIEIRLLEGHEHFKPFSLCMKLPLATSSML